MYVCKDFERGNMGKTALKSHADGAKHKKKLQAIGLRTYFILIDLIISLPCFPQVLVIIYKLALTNI